MIAVTYPVNQDFDDEQYLYTDLAAHPADYLNHPDGTVRSLADWTMEAYKLRNLRPTMARDAVAGRQRLKALYARLQYLTEHTAEP